MVYVVKIDNKTKKGRLAVELLRTLDDSKSITFMEEEEDHVLLAMMKKGLKSGKAETSKVLERLKKIAEQ